MAKVNRIGVIDIGFTKIRTLIAEEEVPGKIRINGLAIEKADGFKNGVIINLDKALKTLRSCIEKTEKEGIRFKKLPVYVGIQGNYIRYTRTHADIRRKNPRDTVSEKEIKQVKKEAHSMKPPPDERFLHLISLSYSLDGMKGIQDPRDFRECHRLEVEGLLIQCKSLVLSNLEQLLDKLEIRNWQFVFQPLAAGTIVAETEDKDLGFVLIDLGGWTAVSIYKDGELQHFTIIEIGGEQLTNDLSLGLRVKKDVAEEIKEKFGATKFHIGDTDETIPLPTSSLDEKYCFRRVVAEIMEARLEEILLACRQAIDDAGYSHSLISGAILIGGGAKIPGIENFAAHFLGVPTRVGITEMMGEEFKQPDFVTTLGLVKFALSNLSKRYALIEEEDLLTKFKQFFKRVFRIADEE
ncbi:MAG: cell division protein FtsA [candidate division WOR-3 bacterium]